MNFEYNSIGGIYKFIITREEGQVMKRRAKLLSIVLAAVLLFGLLPVSLPAVSAVPSSGFEGHRGTATAARTIYVSPNGSDVTGNGTQANPFATVAAAQAKVRTLPKGAGDGDIVVEIASGFYEMTELEFDAADSGNENCTIYYQAAEGARPILSGGSQLPKGVWTQVPSAEVTQAGSLPVYKTTLVRDSKLRAIYVNEQRANMTLSGNVSTNTTNAPTVDIRTFINGEAQSWAIHARNAIPAGLMIASTVGITTATKNPQNIEASRASGAARWARPMICFESVEASGSNILLRYQMPYGAIAQSLNDNTGFATGTSQIRNAWEFLNKRGDFYFDQAESTLYYIPLAGEDINTAEVVIPNVNTVIDVRGIPVGDRLNPNPANNAGRVRYITFSGLTIAHTDYKLEQIEGSYRDSVLGVRKTMSEGFASVQGCVVARGFMYSSGSGGGSNATGMNWHNGLYRQYDIPPAAVQFNAARNIRLLDGEVMLCGYSAVLIENDVQEIEVTGNLIRDTLSTAVIIGHPQHIYENDVAGVHDSPQMVLTNGFTFSDYPADNIPSGGVPASTVAGVDKEKFKAGTEAVPMHIYITNNFIYRSSYGFPGANSLASFYTTDMEVLHNHLEDCTYGAMNIGWGWCEYDGHRYGENGETLAAQSGPYQGTSETSAARLAAITTTSRANKINNNRIEDAMRVLNDSGTIYTLGRQGDPGILPGGGSWYTLTGTSRALTSTTPTDPTHNWHPDNWTNFTEMSYNYLNPDPTGRLAAAGAWANAFHPDEGSTFIKMIGNVTRSGSPSTSDTARLFELNSWKRKSDMLVADTFMSHRNNQNGAPRAAVNEVNNNTVWRGDIWPQAAHDTIMNSGLEDRYMHLIPTSLLSRVHRELVCSVKTLGGSLLNKRGLLSAADEVWIAPAGTTTFVEGPTMTKSTGDAKTYLAPADGGRYRMIVKYADGTLEQSTYFIDIASTGDAANVQDGGSYRVSPAGPLTLALNTTDFTFTLNGASVANGYKIETEGSWTLVATALLSSSIRMTYNFTTYMLDADKLLPRNVNLAPGGTLVFQYDLNDPTKDIWLVNASNTFFDETGVMAAKVAGDAKTMTVPTTEGTYVLLVVTAGTEDILSESLAKVTVADIAIPTDGLDLWLDASRDVTTDASNNVTSWIDQVGGLNLTPTSTTARPTLVTDAIRRYKYINFATNGTTNAVLRNTTFGGSGNTSKYNGLTAMSVVTVTLPTSNPNANMDRGAVVSLGENGSWAGMYVGPGSTSIAARFGGQTAGTGVTNVGSSWNRPATITSLTTTVVVNNAGSHLFYSDGSLASTTTGKRTPMGGLTSTLTVGSNAGSPYFTGRVAEILIYDRALTATEVAQIQAYIEEKYSLTGVLKYELMDIIAAAKAVGSDEFTVAGWTALQDKVAEAEALVDNAAATQTEVDAMCVALKNAMIRSVVKTPVRVNMDDEDFWKQAATLNINRMNSGTATTATGTAKLLWDNISDGANFGNLYVRVEVTDPDINYVNSSAHLKDSVEIYLSEQGVKNNYSSTTGNQYRLALNGGSGAFSGKTTSTAAYTMINSNAWRRVVRQTDTGYIAYLAIPLMLDPVKDGNIMTFDVQINDATTPANNRTGITTWNDPTADGYNTAAGWGEIILSATTAVNKNALKAAVASFNALAPNNYTSASWASAEAVCGDAVLVVGNDDATQAMVDAATEALLDAIDDLVEIDFTYGNQPASAVIRKGMKYQINIETNNPGMIFYVSSNANATVDANGLVTAVKTGSAVITVIDSWAQKYFTIAINITS